jgi:hypothetical protein
MPWKSEEELRALDLWLSLYCHSSYAPPVKAMRVAWMIKRAKRIQYLIDNLPADKLVMFEEGLVQSLLHIGPHSPENLETLYHLLVGLNGIVFLDSDADTVMRQVSSSYHAKRSYLYNTENVTLADIQRRLVAARQLADFLESKGVPVVRLHTDELRETQLASVFQAIDQLGQMGVKS